MGLAWGERKRLMRLTGLADELLNATRMPRDPAGAQALETELDSLVSEVQAVLQDSDARLADEFLRVVVRSEEPRPPDLRAASLAGWLRAEVHVENLEEARAQMGVSDQEPKRRLTIGFRSRSQVAPRAESTVPE
jgi:hypothetical protein